MPRPMFRSRTFRRVKVRIPGGKVVMHYRRRKPSRPVCAITGQILPGVPQGRAGVLRKLAKSKRRPERPFGGVLSSKAMRQIFKNRARTQKQ